MTKTAVLSGSEVKVSDLGGQNVAVKNLGDGSIYASHYPNVVAGADNVVEIPAGSGEVVLDAQGTVYLLGTGKAQCTGTPYATPNFKMPSSSTSGGGGGKEQFGVVCGDFEYFTGGIKSVPVEFVDSIEKSFAATLAKETGWGVQSDGVTVLKDNDIGFCFRGAEHRYVDLITDRNYRVDYFQYLLTTGSQYFMDICTSSTGGVAFGFRTEAENPNLTFLMVKNSTGGQVCVATYQNSPYLLWGENGARKPYSITSANSRITTQNIQPKKLGMFNFMDILNGGVFEDCYLIYSCDGVLSPGDQIMINNKRFAVVYNRAYSSSSQPWLAIAIN